MNSTVRVFFRTVQFTILKNWTNNSRFGSLFFFPVQAYDIVHTNPMMTSQYIDVFPLYFRIPFYFSSHAKRIGGSGFI